LIVAGRDSIVVAQNVQTGNLLGFPEKPIKAGNNTIQASNLVFIVFEEADPAKVASAKAAVENMNDKVKKYEAAVKAASAASTDATLAQGKRIKIHKSLLAKG
jgi:hypothetical protein